uniref:Uncharacterized protein n=1 Tax=Leptosiphonia brodiei TaxID=2608611 RepID=A0A1Z1M9R0_9FLOR|nr:hypothetical protein [Leptosiphonia brodiei]ARW62847.1 hypothetical protein [Leptosiphonia brodiei]
MQLIMNHFYRFYIGSHINWVTYHITFGIIYDYKLIYFLTYWISLCIVNFIG